MPGHGVFHEGHAFALDGLGDDGRRFPFQGLGLGQSRFDGVVIVAVDVQDIPAEGPELVGNRHDVHDFFIGPVDLQAVVVDEQRQVVQLILSC